MSMSGKQYSVGGITIKVSPQWTIFANLKSRKSHVVTLFGLPGRVSVKTYTITELCE